MVTRSSTQVVTFKRPFILNGFSQVEPSGIYIVSLLEEHVEPFTSAPESWRQVSLSIRLESDGAVRHIAVDPAALVAALERDQAQATHTSLRQVAKARHLTARNLNAFSGRRGHL